jgi:predicted AlkP superfamily pyrophosphatase or phosphodiesterase
LKVLARTTAVLLALTVLPGACRAPDPRTAATVDAGDGTRGTRGVNRPAQQAKPYVILMSFDGFKPEYLDRFDLPAFRRVIERGVRAEAMRPVFPSLTFPNHFSLVTGLYPERHGLVENTFHDPERNQTYSIRDRAAVSDGTWYRGEPIWVTAETQGMVAACFFWPGSEAAIRGVRPTFWNTYDATIPNDTRIQTVLEWLRLPPERRPHVITLYFSDLDVAAHRGPLDAPAIAEAAQSVDRALGALLAGLDALPIRDDVYLLLTSDHGMAEMSGRHIVMLNSLIDPAAVTAGYDGPIAGLHVNGPSGDARQIRDAINARLGHGRAYLRAEVPEQHHFREDPRIGDIVIIMDEPWVLLASMPLTGLVRERWGNHGWDPSLPSMHAIFIVAGPNMPAGVTIPIVDNIDVYPLMTELLGLRGAKEVDGQPHRIRAMIDAAAADRRPRSLRGVLTR